MRSVPNDCEKLAKKAEDRAVEVDAEDMSMERDIAQAKAGGELKTMTAVLGA